MSVIARGFINNTIITRGFTKQNIFVKIATIFLQSNVLQTINVISRFF